MTSAGRRVLVTGVSSLWGGMVAQSLEGDPRVEVIIGLGTDDPSVALKRTECVRANESYSILSRIVQATQVDTILHTSFIVDSTMGRGSIHETNVIGTLNLLAAAGDSGSPVRQVVVKSSTLVYGSSPRDPAWFSEETVRPSPAATALERSLLEAESYLKEFADDHPEIDVALLRFANVLGPDMNAPMAKALSLPVIPSLFGFDAQMQVVDQDDVVRAVVFAANRRLRGIYNVAGDGRLPWSEIAAIMGKRQVPLPPIFTALAAGGLGRLAGTRLPPELLDLLRFGRGVDTNRLKRAGFAYCSTSATTVDKFAKRQRLERVVGRQMPYHYERDVESFFQHSPAVVRRESPLS